MRRALDAATLPRAWCVVAAGLEAGLASGDGGCASTAPSRGSRGPITASIALSLTPSLSASAVIEFTGVAGLSLGTAWVTGRGPDGDGFTDRGPGDRARDTRSGTEGESPRQAMSRLDMRRFPLSRCRSPTCVTWSDVLDVRCVAVTAAPSESGPPATATATATDQTRGGALAYSLWAWTSGGRCGGANLRTCGGWTCVEQVWRWW